jgi:GAF domain-containing protein
LFASLEIPIGAGLSGWVAENRKPIVNGNPSVEPGYLNDPTRFSILRSALAVPLISADGFKGVLSLYLTDADASSTGHLAALMSLAPILAGALELTTA